MYRTGEIFTVWREKSFVVRELVQDTYWARSEAASPILFKSVSGIQSFAVAAGAITLHSCKRISVANFFYGQIILEDLHFFIPF
jgi:hypothetical protein